MSALEEGRLFHWTKVVFTATDEQDLAQKINLWKNQVRAPIEELYLGKLQRDNRFYGIVKYSTAQWLIA